MRTVRPWTTGEVRRLLDLRAQRHTLTACARALERTVGSVSMKLSTAGQCRPYKANRRKRGNFPAAVRRLCKPGRADREVAERLGTTTQEVFRARKKLGIPAGLTPAEASRRSRGVRRNRPECWCCGVRCPYPTARNGWRSRVVGAGALGVRECYCPTCFGKWGWPVVPRRITGG